MRGKHHVVVETARLKYTFDISRNITVIQGDSATGKTTLIDLLSEYKRSGEGKGISVSSDVPCYVYTGGGNNNYQPAVIEDEWEKQKVLDFMNGKRSTPQ